MKSEDNTKFESIIASLPAKEAITKLEGHLRQQFWNNQLRVILGGLYLQESDFVKAGKMLYFKSNKSEKEERAFTRFKESCGNNKVEIFKKLVLKSKSPRGITIEMNEKIFDLIRQILTQEKNLPNEVARWILQYERIRNSEIKNNLLKK